MSDIADDAQVYTDTMLSAALTHREPELPFRGRCYNCAEPLPSGTFCGPLDDGSPSYCREDYEALKRNKR